MSRNFWIGLVASVVVIALAVGVLALVTSLRDSDVELPDEVGGLVALDTDAAFPESSTLDDEKRAQTIADRREAQEYAADKLSDAFDGADAAVRSYGEADVLDPLYLVTAVADDAGPLIPENGFDDPEYLRTALPRVDRVSEGDAACLIHRNQPPLADREYDDEAAAIDHMVCQRTSGSLTVRVSVTDGDVERTVDLLDDVWDELD